MMEPLLELTPDFLDRARGRGCPRMQDHQNPRGQSVDGGIASAPLTTGFNHRQSGRKSRGDHLGQEGVPGIGGDPTEIKFGANPPGGCRGTVGIGLCRRGTSLCHAAGHQKRGQHQKTAHRGVNPSGNSRSPIGTGARNKRRGRGHRHRFPERESRVWGRQIPFADSDRDSNQRKAAFRRALAGIRRRQGPLPPGRAAGHLSSSESNRATFCQSAGCWPQGPGDLHRRG